MSTELETGPASPRITRVAPVEDARAWARALAAFHPGRAAQLKIDGSAAVWRADLAGRSVVIKTWAMRSFADRLKLACRMARGDRHWRGARWLLDNGFHTARPLVLATDRGPAGPRQWLVMEYLDGPTVLDCIIDGTLAAKDEHGLARALASQVSEMVALGRFNRDHKPSNLIVTGVGTASPRVAIIDCVAIRKCRRFDFSMMRRMLASLYIEPLGLGAPPRRSLCMRALTSIDARSWWQTLEHLVVSHGDPRSRVDPRAGR
ncbi:MAG: hypothetical protein AMXMBFR58_11510 [Phycisphaerae bacterium]